MTDERAIIRYESRSTVNDKPVGSVYVRRLDPPLFGEGVYSYTKDPADATAWDSIDVAEQVLRQHTWQQARAVLLRDAKVLQ